MNLYGPPRLWGKAINPEHGVSLITATYKLPSAAHGHNLVFTGITMPTNLLYQLLVAYLQTGDHTFVDCGGSANPLSGRVDLVSPSTLTRPFWGLNHVQAAQTGKPVGSR